MKLTKRLIVLLLAICLCVGLMTVTASAAETASGSCGANITWTLADGTLTISGSGNMMGYEDGYPQWNQYSDEITRVVIKKGVTSVGAYAFSGLSKMEEVSLPKGLTYIGRDAFNGCTALTSVVLPDGLTELGYAAFKNCTRLTSINIPDSVTSINRYCFSYCKSLTSIAIPAQVTFLDESVFSGCSSLASVTLPEGLTSIGAYAFSNCSILEQVTIPASVTKIGNNAFISCPNVSFKVAAGNTVYSSDSKGVLFDKGKTTLLQAPATLSGAYTIPNTVKTISSNAFNNCRNLTKVTMSDSVAEIGDYAFNNCPALTSVKLSGSLSAIPSNLFQFCEGLTSITIPNGVTTIGSYAFYGCSALKTVELPATLTTLESGVFDACTSLSSITLPNSLTSIGRSCFYGCENLTSINIPSAVTSIGSSCFYDCTSLTKITVASGNPNYSSDSKGVLFNKDKTLLVKAPAKLSGVYTVPTSVTEFEDSAFYGCTALTGVTIPDGVVSLPYSLFEECESLTTVKLPAKLETIGSSAFWNCAKLTQITLPSTLKSINSSAFADTGLTEVKIPASVDYVDGYAFSGCASLKKITVVAANPNYCSDNKGVLYNKDKTELVAVPCGISGSYTLPNTITSLPYAAFSDCKELTSITLSEGITMFDGNTFRNCEKLSSINIPSTVTYIGRNTFQNCGLTAVTIPAGVEYIDVGAFSSCTKLEKITVASGNQNYCSVGGILFSKDKTTLVQYPAGLSGSYTIPNTVTTVGSAAFQGSAGLTGVTIPSSVTTLRDAFIGCTALKSVEIPGTITSMDACGFMNCTALESATLGSGVTRLAYNTFAGCTSLTDVNLPDTLTSIGWAAFKDCTELDTLVIPENVNDISFGFVQNCTDLDDVIFTGNAPTMYPETFWTVKTVVWYPVGNSTWTKNVRQDYGGDLTWKSYKPLGIKTQPTTQKVKNGTTAKFTVSASGPALSYQWQYRTSAKGVWKNATATGNKTATLKVPATTAKSGYQYRCKVTDGMGNTVTTKAVYLYVLGIKTQPTAKNVKAGVVAKFTVNAAGHNKTFQWQYKNAAGKWVNATAPGAKTATLKVTAKVAFNGRMYRCVIKDSAGNQVISNAVKLTVFGIKTQPTAKSVKAGNTAKFAVTATGSGLKYQWQYRTSVNGTWKSVGAGKSTLSVSATTAKNGYQYRCKITDSLGRVIYTNIVKLTVK